MNALLLVTAAAALIAVADGAAASGQTPPSPAGLAAGTTAPAADPSLAPVAQMVAGIVRSAIPTHYEKYDGWGATKEIPVGVRVEGKPFYYHTGARTKAVNHGMWKHYTLDLPEPDKNLVVRIDGLRPLGDGRFGFTLEVDAKLDAWGRATVYQYGVHVISLETVADTQIHLTITGEVGVRFRTTDRGPGMGLDPLVKDAHLTLTDFRLRRISDARGPLVHELSEGARKLVEDELDGPRLTAKLNRAIDKKRDRLVISPGDLFRGLGSQGSKAPASAGG